MRPFILAVCSLATFVVAAAHVSAATADLDELLSRAMSENKVTAKIAISQLRSGGQATLDALLAIRAKSPGNEALDDAIDLVGGQKYCTTSRLFWHTDLESAKAVAEETGKPILTLRMLGNLTDELSCANSRFFRTILYANKDISTYLRTNFVLHWESMRPVPKVTIDFGNGRRVECTLGGNSVHYILAPDGSIIDVLPGLYGPPAFAEWLRRGSTAARACLEIAPNRRQAVLMSYHQERLRAITRDWEADIVKLGGTVPKAGLLANQDDFESRAATQAIEALEGATDVRLWKKIAALHDSQAEISESSKDTIRSQVHSAYFASLMRSSTPALDLDFAKGGVNRSIERSLGNFQASVELDTVCNEYLRHSRIHTGYIEDSVFWRVDVEMMDSYVYKYLFQTPLDEPSLGLVPRDTYTALENGGVFRPARK